MPRVLNGGVIRTKAAVRVTARRKAAASWLPTASCRPLASCRPVASRSPTASCGPVIGASRLEQGRDQREQVVGEALERPQRPSAGEDEDERGREELGQERERGLLHLGRR